jgi:ubiquinone/menaquinone biosynthesis C-methylase UbiE
VVANGQGWQMRKVWEVEPVWRVLGGLTVCLVALSASLPAQPAQSAQPALSPSPASPASQVPPASRASRARPTQQTHPKGRLFPPQDLGLLEPSDRDEWSKPDLIMDDLSIADGSVVADLGAGGGWFTIRLARRVGPNGLVLAEDIQPLMIEAIGRRVQREGLSNVQTVLGTASDPKLPPGFLDAVLIADSYHEMDDPARPEVILTLLSNVARSLKPQGRLGVVDFLPGGGGPGPLPEERVDPEAAIKAASAAGLKLQTHEQVPPFLFLLVFGKSSGAHSSR